MTASLASVARAVGEHAGRGGAIRSRLPMALTGFVASIFLATVAAASTPLIGWIGEPANPAASLPVQAAPEGAAEPLAAPAAVLRSRRRWSCGGCGVVESVRLLERTGDEPAAYEFTVRLRDGSTRTSTIANTARWRAGDRILLIGGVQPAAL